ncbi:hypothetical protein BDZ89DRAFT_1032951 [Hymenopellis radicata]|nr:hypothetical protein BDZ89DRAFT_1032951 [Hymenopellis radicata]
MAKASSFLSRGAKVSSFLAKASAFLAKASSFWYLHFGSKALGADSDWRSNGPFAFILDQLRSPSSAIVKRFSGLFGAHQDDGILCTPREPVAIGYTSSPSKSDEGLPHAGIWAPEWLRPFYLRRGQMVDSDTTPPETTLVEVIMLPGMVRLAAVGSDPGDVDNHILVVWDLRRFTEPDFGDCVLEEEVDAKVLALGAKDLQKFARLRLEKRYTWRGVG